MYAGIACLLLFMALGIIRCASSICKKQKITRTEDTSAPVLEPVKGVMFCKYSYANPSGNDLLSNLMKVNLSSPNTRPFDEHDKWFKEATPLLMHDGECLAYLNHYGYIADTFWKNIAELDLHPEEDKEFQQLLVSCYKTEWGGKVWWENFRNLLYIFGGGYRLLPEIENILDTDSRLAEAKDTYDRARKSKMR